jgi:chemotaxis protein methyltransferase CheR
MAVVVLEACRALEIDPASLDLKILASDLSPRALARGRRGVYSLDQARAIPRHLRSRYFCEEPDGVAVSAEAKTRVVFRRVNLARPPFPMKGPLQAIFLRAGLALLDASASRRVLAAAKGVLAAGGLLCGCEDMPELGGDDTETHPSEAWEGVPTPASEIC